MIADGPSRPPYGAAALTAFAVWLLYVVTLAPTTAFWDTSEYIATAHIVGIPHPPGNALFVLAAKAWTLLLAPLGLSVAVRVNLFAATTSAAASGFLFLVAHRVASGFVDSRRAALAGAVASTVIGATAFTVWNQSNVNEKVYTVSMLVVAIVSWLAVLWRDRRDDPGAVRYMLWAVFLIALGSTNHPMSMLPAPALAVFALLTGPGRLLRPGVLGRGALLVVLGLSFNFVLPIRAAQEPAINEGEPTCESITGAAAAIYAQVLPTVVADALPSCRALADNLARVQYQTPPVTQRKAPYSAQLAMYFQYFDWQWARGVDPSPTPSLARLPFTILFLALGLAGLWAAWLGDRAVFAYLVGLAGTLTLALVVYLNFRYGYSLAPEVTDPAMHEVRERDYFYVAGFLLWGVLAGLGLTWTWHTLAGARGGGRRYVASSPVLVMALFPLLLNWQWASRSGDYAARDWAYDLLMSVEPYAILFTNGDNDTFPLWYLQEVEGIRRDVTVIVGQYLLTDWYPRQLERMTRPENQRPFDGSVAPGLYADPGLPSRSITSLPGDRMDAVGSVSLPEDLTVGFPGLALTYPAGTFLHRGNQLALRIIQDSVDERPIFFAAVGGMMSELGMERWAVRHGLASKLVLRNLASSSPGLVQGSPEYGAVWHDLERSLTLYREVFLFRGLLDRPIWQDRASLNIPLQYYVMAAQLADAAEVGGEGEDVTLPIRGDAASFEIVAAGGYAGMLDADTALVP